MKRDGKVARFKLQRRLMMELPGLGKAGAIERKPYPPGQHGAQRIKYSEFRLQLEEKQKIRLHYNLREEQLLRLVKMSKKVKAGVWVESLINKLERRLENIIFRAGLAPSQMSAAQLISHGQVLVNKKKVNIRSYIVKPTDIIELTAKGLKNQIVLQAQQSPRLPLPNWLNKEQSDSAVRVRLIDQPQLIDVPFAFDHGLVTSYYSKVKV